MILMENGEVESEDDQDDLEDTGDHGPIFDEEGEFLTTHAKATSSCQENHRRKTFSDL